MVEKASWSMTLEQWYELDARLSALEYVVLQLAKSAVVASSRETDALAYVPILRAGMRAKLESTGLAGVEAAASDHMTALVASRADELLAQLEALVATTYRE